jgi:hypothetical protein
MITMVALTAIALLVAATMWLSLRVAAISDLAVLPANCRKRLQWWRLNAKHVYLICATVGFSTVVLQLHQLIKG